MEVSVLRDTETHVTDSMDDSVVIRDPYLAIKDGALMRTTLLEISRNIVLMESSCRVLNCLSVETYLGAWRYCMNSFVFEYPVSEILLFKNWLEADLNRFRVSECFDEMKKSFRPLANELRTGHAVVVSAVVLLSYVYLYLTGCGGWDGSKAESSGSLDYRDTYISIVLFQGAYVWIKFRDVASTKPVPKGAVRTIATPCKYGRTKVKYEPRFKPRQEIDQSFNRMYLGQFDSCADAEVVYRMAASCYEYGKCYGTPVDLAGDGRELFTIIPEFTPEEQTISGREKLELVKVRVKELYESYKEKKDALNLPPTLPGANLEQELENRRLQSEVLIERQQKEDLACQVRQSQDVQQAQQFRIKNLQLQVENLQLQVQDFQQAHQFQVQNLQLQVQDLQQAHQFQVQNLQLQLQLHLQHLQQPQREAESFPFDEFSDGLII